MMHRNYIERGSYRLPNKVDATGNGIKDNAIDIKWDLYENSRGETCFTMSGTIWNRLKTDCISAGQNIDTIRKLTKFNPVVKQMYLVWKEYHLNDMSSGSPRQEGFKLALNYIRTLSGSPNISYDDLVHALDECNLLVDWSCVNPNTGNLGYKYGSARLTKEIPEQVIEIIQEWSDLE